MKFELDKVEQEVEESLFLKGEALYAADESFQLNEIEKNIWLAHLEGFEIELQLAGNKTKNFTCECSAYHQDGICGHIIAVILAVRKRRVTKPVAPQPKRRVYKAPKRLTVHTILDSIDNPSLRDFILEYARKDQQFTTALKARFASSVDHLDLEEKYAQLLQTLIKSNQSANHSFSRTGAKKVYDALQILMDQADNDLVEKNFLEVYELARHIIFKLGTVIGRFTSHKNDILSCLERAFLLLIKLSSETIPPALKESMVDTLVEVLRDRHFNFDKIDALFLSLLLKYADYDKLAEEMLPETSRMYRNREMETTIFVYHAAVLYKKKENAELRDLLSRVDKRPWLIMNLVQVSYDWHLYGLTRVFAAHALQSQQPAGVIERIEEILLQVALKEENDKEIKALAGTRLLNTLNINYFDQFKKGNPGKREINKLIKDLNQLPASERKWQLLSAIYEKEERPEDLFELISEVGSLDLLSRFIVPMFAIEPAKTKELSWKILNHFLETHVGRPPSVKTRNFLRHLYVNDMEKLARFLLGNIRKLYGDRNSIEEELGLFR
ncbi:MAG: hypothetical protein KDC24_06785 [Saprospiraceae bacterium]|nr:hypothetical protein [Saprospiraceae bacterium]